MVNIEYMDNYQSTQKAEKSNMKKIAFSIMMCMMASTGCINGID